MPDFRITAVSTGETAAFNQFNSFAEGRSWLIDDEDQLGNPIKVDALGVTIHPFQNDNGEFRWDVRLYGQMAIDDSSGEKEHPTKVDGEGNPLKVAGSFLREDFEANGTKIADKLVERRRVTHDVDGNVTGDEVYATGNLEAWRWLNVILIGDVVDGEWPTELIEHTWASADKIVRA